MDAAFDNMRRQRHKLWGGCAALKLSMLGKTHIALHLELKGDDGIGIAERELVGDISEPKRHLDCDAAVFVEDFGGIDPAERHPLPPCFLAINSTYWSGFAVKLDRFRF
jgi:hypothetical protein